MQLGVVCRIYGARRADECSYSTLFVEYRRYSDIVHRGVEGHEVAAHRYPQRHVGIRKFSEIFKEQHVLVRELVFRTMTGVVHYERTLVLLAHYSLAGIGICHSRSLYNGWIRVPHHLVDTQRRILGYHLFGYYIGIHHVAVLVAVVAHEHYFVEPCRSSGILHVALYLVNHRLGFCRCSHWESANGYIHLVDIQRSQAFAVVEHAVKRIVDITKSLVERFLAFVCQQIIVGFHLPTF